MSNVELHRKAHETMSEKGAQETGQYFADEVVYFDAARGLRLNGKSESSAG